MANGISTGWSGGSQSRRRSAGFSTPMLGDEGEAFDGAVTYEEVIRRKGARFDPESGHFVRIVALGGTMPSRRRDGTWSQPHEKRFIASSLEEARENGMMWDYYAMGLRCKKEGCNDLLTGWVRGGRKLEIEHAHIDFGHHGAMLEYEVSAPSDGDEGSDPLDAVAIGKE